MDHQLNVPDDVYSRLIGAADEAGTTPIGWLSKNLPPAQEGNPEKKHRTMADVLGDSIGKFRSGGDLRASERVDELFGEYLEQKRREGRL